jgi:hypothetical protein
MTSWDVDITRKHLENLYGHERFDLYQQKRIDFLRPYLQSVLDRRTYAGIHFHDLQTLFDEFVQTNLQKSSVIKFRIGEDRQAQNKLDDFIRRIGAYFIACIHSIHSVPDILAHVIYYSLAMDTDKSKLSLVSIGSDSVIKKLESVADATDLRNLMVNLVKGGSFPHLSALSNHSKHRSLIPHLLRESLLSEQPDRHTIRISTFEYKNEIYPEVIAKDFLADEYKHLSLITIKIGNELNSLLAKRVANKSID